MKKRIKLINHNSGDSVSIIHGDCLKVLAGSEIPPVDLVHTSPPYNIDKPYQEYTDKLQLADYLSFIAEVASALSSKMRLGGSLFWQTGYTQASKNSDEINPIDMLTFPLFKEHGFYLKDRIVWHYYGGMSFKSKFKNQHETILWFVRGDPADTSHLPYFDVDAVREKSREHDPRNNLLGRNPGNVWAVDRVAYGGVEQTSHIAVFPEEVTERIVRACSKPGDVVLDPFLGSGTVAKVARSLGRRYFGIELSRSYYNESVKRVAFQQFGEVDTVFSDFLKTFLTSVGSQASIEDCRFFFRSLLLSRPSTIETKVSQWCRKFVDVDNIPKKEKPRLWLMGEEFIDALPSAVTAEAGLVTNIAVAYLNNYKLAKHFNGLRLGLIAHALQMEIETVLESDDKIVSMLERAVTEESSSYEKTRGGKAIILKQTGRRVKERKDHSKANAILPDAEPMLL